MGLKVQFLGTGTSQGVPMIACPCKVCRSADPKDNRLRSSILMEIDGLCVVVDTTPDFRYQMLRAGVRQLDAVLITHGHKDHVAGMDDIRAFNYFQGTPIDVYASDASQRILRQEFHYAFAEHKYPGVPEIRLKSIGRSPFNIGSLHIIPIEVLHYQMPVLGFRIGSFTYITDANFISEEQKDKIRGSKVLVVNALRKEPHISHFTLDQALVLCDELNIESAYFTHISHQLGLHEEISRELPPGRHLAYDNLVLEL